MEFGTASLRTTMVRATVLVGKLTSTELTVQPRSSHPTVDRWVVLDGTVESEETCDTR
jgi:hypothetical protein